MKRDPLSVVDASRFRRECQSHRAASILHHVLPPPTKFPWQILSTVDHGDDLDTLLSKLIQYAIVLNDQLSERLMIDFWDPTPHLRMFGKRFDGGVKAIDNCGRVLGRAPLKIVPNCLQVGQCFLRPDYVSHWSSRCSTSSCGTVRPSSASRRPRSIFWRT